MNELDDKQLALTRLPESAVNGVAEFTELKTRATPLPMPDGEKERGNGYITPPSMMPPPAVNVGTLFDLSPYTTEPQPRKVTVHVKKTTYERSLPKSRKESKPKKERKAKQTITERFEIYHRDHPFVYNMLVALARADLKAGMKHGGLQMYLELVRHRMKRKTRDRSTPFKISNDYARPYAKLIMQQESDLAGFFEVRDRKS